MKICEELKSWTCVDIFAHEVSTVLVKYSVWAIWVRFAGPVELDNSECGAVLTLI